MKINPYFLPPTNLRAIKLAREAMATPLPPTFTPYAMENQLWENLDMRMPAGTLLVIWENNSDNENIVELLSRLNEFTKFDIISVLLIRWKSINRVTKSSISSQSTFGSIFLNEIR